MTPFWDRIRTGIAEGLKAAAENTEDLRRVGSVELAIYKLQKDIRDTEAELGRRTRQLFGQGTADWVSADSATRDLIARLDALSTLLSQRQRESDDLLKDDAPAG